MHNLLSWVHLQGDQASIMGCYSNYDITGLIFLSLYFNIKTEICACNGCRSICHLSLFFNNIFEAIYTGNYVVHRIKFSPKIKSYSIHIKTILIGLPYYDITECFYFYVIWFIYHMNLFTPRDMEKQSEKHK